MSIEVLNTQIVSAKMKELGTTRKFVIAKLGLKKSVGYAFLRGEWLPENSARKTLLLKRLSRMIGVGVPQILQRYEAVKSSA